MARSEDDKVFHSGDDPGCQSEPSWQDFVSMRVARGNASVRTVPTFDLEAELMDALHGPIVGIDEAGRGPWAGPVVVAAVILNPDRIPEGLNNSKVLTAEAREDRYAEIMATSCVSIVIGQVRRIDRDNILQATLWGMRAAYRGLQTPAATALIDGNIVPKRFPVQGPRAGRRRRPLALHRRGLHRRQGHARPADGEARAPLPALWLGIEQGIRHARACASHQEARRVHASSPLLQPDRARASASHSAF